MNDMLSAGAALAHSPLVWLLGAAAVAALYIAGRTPR